MSTIQDDIGWMICHSWDCGDAPGDVSVLNTEALKDKLERYVAEREEQLKRENAALRAIAQSMVDAFDYEREMYAAHGGYGAGPKEPELIAAFRAALSPQEAARG